MFIHSAPGQSTDHMQAHWRSLLVVIPAILPLLATVFMRSTLVGGLPATDEGFYAFHSQVFFDALSTGKHIPKDSMLMLYPLLGSWVWAFDWNPIITLRLIDAICAVIVAILLYAVATKESGSRYWGALIAAVFAFHINNWGFIQSGFKNSIIAAAAPLLLALLIGLNAKAPDSRRWIACGSLVAMSVLLREAFSYFAVYGGIAILLSWGWKGFGRYVLGGLATGAIVIAVVVPFRGSLEIPELASAYQVYAGVLNQFSNQRFELFLSSGWSFLQVAAGAILVGAFCCALAVWCMFRGHRTSISRWAFWIGATLVPLIEPILKFGFPYHFSVTLFGLCGLSALACSYLASLRKSYLLGVSAAIVAVPAFIAVHLYGGLYSYFYQITKQNMATASTNTWPRDMIERSNYLFIADLIKKNTTGHETLSVSGLMLTLFPLSERLPPSFELADLNLAALKVSDNPNELERRLRECPPDLIVLSTRDFPGMAAVKGALANIPEYKEIAAVPVTTTRDYGSFGATLLRREGNTDLSSNTASADKAGCAVSKQ